ncbi:MAG: two-component regulator propeller domain-containing protein [Candidatus Pedobacter colombiensis]|uniref:histidine kinase n=1 Tax=Candidatus Pedobacter colombiensis TaxID=3121371 RepID=A0AAJ6B845_9SPHI|nr:hybrid sensor histidine kinase/response regulator transcription factor [Pedobacter sp.]WEK20146.1 MAG: two-component regulator propeller domain-containing protein [Pedobacter sp.]
MNKFFLIVVFLLQSLLAVAQLNSNITRYTTRDGLSHDGVLCITRDRDGFMWFGTFDGINRFDGHDFVVYKSRPGDSSNLSSNKIRSIVEDKAAFLWVKTYDNKVYRFNKKTEQFLAISDGSYKHLFKDLVIDRIIPDTEDGVWLLTENQGLLHAMNNFSGKPEINYYAKRRTSSFNINGNTVKFLQREGNRIWIGTEGGLNCLQPNKDKKYIVVKFSPVVTKFLSANSFTCSAKNKDFLFFGTTDGNLVTYHIKKKVFSIRPLGKDTKLNAICSSRRPLLYISTTGRGLVTLDLKTFKCTYSGLGANDTYLSLYEDKDGQVWIEPEKNGVLKYNPHTGIYKHFIQKKDVISASRDYQVVTDANGILWTSMKGGGFGYYNPVSDDIAYFYDEPGTKDQKFSNIITSLLIDKTGVLWLSAKDGGVNKVVPITDKFNYRRLVGKPENRSENNVRAMMKDSRGRLWICTKDAMVYVYENNKPASVFINPPQKLGCVYSIIEDRKGNIWLGTKGDGLFKASPVDPGKSFYALTNFRNDKSDQNSLSSDLVYSVIEDRKGRIWVGTLGGGINLLTSSEGKIAFKNYYNVFKNYPFSWANVIRHLNEDNQGRIWVGTSNGLLIFDPNQVSANGFLYQKYQKVKGDRSSLGNNSVQYIYKDQVGQMWVGTFGGGLNKVIRANKGDIKFEVFTTENGLSNDVVLGITGDQQNNIWIATEGGLSQFNPGNKTFKNYDTYDGLPESGFSEAACFSAGNGKLYFGCIDGYISFNPINIIDQKINAEMALTRMQLYYKDMVPGIEGSPLKYAINETNELSLKHDQNAISIDYAVLDYRAFNKITYAYKLEGFDKSWHHVNDQRKATYTNLPPGKYTFKVKAASEDLFSNTPEKILHLIVKPPFYLTYWAYFVYLVLVAAIAVVARRIILTMIRLRNKVVVEQKLTEVKLSFFTNISHELRTPLTLIVSPLEEISRTETLSVKGTAYLNIVNRNANRMIRFINQLLDFRKIQSDKMQLNIAKIDLLALVRDICHHFTGMAEEKSIIFNIAPPGQEIYAWVDEEKIDIIIYNLLSNAFKFSPANTSITVTISHISETEEIELCIIDEGRGVPADKLEEIFEIYYEGNTPGERHLHGTGIGLALARDLALSHHGKLWAQKNTGSGMTFILRLKSGKSHFKTTEVKFDDAVHNTEFINIDAADMIPEKSVKNIRDMQTPTVLIVEDNPELRNFLSVKLDGLYQVKSAADGAEGLNAAVMLLPDLIISDVMMPNMDGIQMLDQLKNDIRTSHIPMILLTAKSSVESQIEGLKYGADLYITKPFHTDYLLISIENLINSRKKLFEQLSNALNKKIVTLGPEEIVITSKDETFLKETIKIVEEGMKDSNFNIEEVATTIGMGRTTFYKKLKSLTSLSPVEFVRDMRLKRSKQLLDAGMQTVSEIGYLVGFNSLPYFSTCFKEKYKISPSEYMKGIKKDLEAVNR